MKVTNVTITDLEESIKASKYPMAVDTEKCNVDITDTVKKLGHAPRGTAHDNFLHGIHVGFDLTFTNKAWIEMERYHFIDIVSSQSTMHRITKLPIREMCNGYVDERIINIIESFVDEYNSLEDKTTKEAKELYLKILYNIPAGIELTARISTNYGQLKTIYFQRKSHRLPEWRKFCEWIEKLPHFKDLCLSQLNQLSQGNA